MKINHIYKHYFFFYKNLSNEISISLSFLLSLALFLAAENIAAQDAEPGFQITSPVTGVIKQVYAQSGQTVKQGELLLEYDGTLIDSNLSVAKANIALAKVNLAEAKKELERAEELYERTVLSDHDLQQAKILYTKASSQYASANNQLIHAQWDKTHSKLKAPFKGRVIKVFSYPGQYVNNEFTAQTLLILEKNTEN